MAQVWTRSRPHLAEAAPPPATATGVRTLALRAVAELAVDDCTPQQKARSSVVTPQV